MPKSKETISDSESSGSGSEDEPVKSKPSKKQEKKEESSASSESEDDSKSKKRQKKASDKGSNKKAKKDDDGESVWDLGSNKQVTVRNFKGKWFVDIREMYMKDGEMKPGKKGVCLKLETWKELYKVADEVNECVKSKC